MKMIKDVQDVMTVAQAKPLEPRVSVDIEGQENDEEVQEGFFYTGKADEANKMVEAVQGMIDTLSEFTITKFYFDKDGALVIECKGTEWYTAASYHVTIRARV